jgi:plastocyanin
MRTALLALTSLAVLACSSSTDNNPPPGSDVSIVSSSGAGAFSPNPFVISLATQTSVKWGNATGVTHHLLADGATPEFNSGNIGSGGSFTHTFTTAGSYPYHCTIHPTMVGTITVNP